MPPRELAAALAERARPQAGDQVGGDRRARLPQHPAGRGRRRRSWPASWSQAGPAVRAQRARWPASGSTWSSSRPTRPARCTSGGVRWAAVGDALARLLRAAGAEVATEYYFNDAGAQIDRFARSLLRRGPGRADAGGRLRAARTSPRSPADRGRAARTCSSWPTHEAQEVFRVEGVAADVRRDQAIAGRVRRALRHVLQREGPARRAASWTRRWTGCAQQGHVYESEGAIWLRTTDFGDDKDRVLRKSATASGRTSPPTAPTTWTSASAASTGCVDHARRRPPRVHRPDARRWRPASATTRTSTWRS